GAEQDTSVEGDVRGTLTRQAAQAEGLLPGRRVPQPNQIRRGNSQAIAVRVERHTEQRGRGCDAAEFRSRDRVPDAHAAVQVAGGGQLPPVRAERDRCNLTGVPPQSQKFLARGGVADLYCPVVAGRGEAATVGAEGQVDDRLFVASEREECCTALYIPHLSVRGAAGFFALG